MKKNMGITDKWVRIVIAVIIIVLSFMKVLKGTAEIILLIVALILLLTSIVNFCPLWALLGINTVPRNKQSEETKS
jgi:hypothetical protein